MSKTATNRYTFGALVLAPTYIEVVVDANDNTEAEELLEEAMMDRDWTSVRAGEPDDIMMEDFELEECQNLTSVSALP